jgi:hypothetical protein
MISGALSQAVNFQGREADYSTSSSAGKKGKKVKLSL